MKDDELNDRQESPAMETDGTDASPLDREAPEIIDLDRPEANVDANVDATVDGAHEVIADDAHEGRDGVIAEVIAEVIELPGPGAELGGEAARAVEAILMVADQPVEAGLLAQLLEISPTAVADLCDRLAESYRVEGRGFELVRVAGGYRFQSHADLAGYVERFALEGQVARLSGAALETLAIVAYKQPISRAQVAQIRGVNVDGVMRTLAMKGYIAEIGTDPGPGQAILFGTTPAFLAGLGIDSLADLAPLGDFVPGPEIMEALEAGLRVERSADEGSGAGAGTTATPGASTAQADA